MPRIVPNPFRATAVVPGHETELLPVYSSSGCLVARYRGNRVGSGLAPGVYFLDVAGSPGLRLVKLP